MFDKKGAKITTHKAWNVPKEKGRACHGENYMSQLKRRKPLSISIPILFLFRFCGLDYNSCLFIFKFHSLSGLGVLISRSIYSYLNFFYFRFGGPDYNPDRMSWIKPNFMWMMYRCGWAQKTNQERVLAIRITKEGFEDILSKAYTAWVRIFLDI